MMYSQLRNEDGRLGLTSLSRKTLTAITSGISSLDAILGGGFPLGSLVLMEEDEYGVHSKTFTKCFISEGIANGDSIFLGSKDENPQKFISELPQTGSRKEEVPKAYTDELKIAWRYQKNEPVPSVPSAQKHPLISHEFDFSCKIPCETIKISDICIWPAIPLENNLSELMEEIFKFIFSRKSIIPVESLKSRKILRIVVQSAGSPFWSEDNESFYKFLYKLRTITHNSSSVAIVTIPSYLFDVEMIGKFRQISDIVISLKSFLNSDEPSLNEFNGLISFLKISAVNSFSIHVPEDIDWAFKVKRKKLIIEKLHLPPETLVTKQREQDDLASTNLSNCHLNF